VSRLAKLHFHINIADWIGKADSIKPFNRNRKTLGKEKCLSWVISDWWNAMAQSRDKVRTDLVNTTKWLEGNGKYMIIAGAFSVLILPAFGRRFSCTSRWYAQVRGGHSVSTVTSQVAQRPSHRGIRVRPSGLLLSDLSRPWGSLMGGKPAWDNARHFKSLINDGAGSGLDFVCRIVHGIHECWPMHYRRNDTAGKFQSPI